MKWIQEGIGAIEIECKECKFSWPRKQSLMALLLLAAFSWKERKILPMLEERFEIEFR